MGLHVPILDDLGGFLFLKTLIDPVRGKKVAVSTLACFTEGFMSKEARGLVSPYLSNRTTKNALLDWSPLGVMLPM